MELNIFRSSFNPTVHATCESLSQERLEEECKRILQSGEKVEISELSEHFANFPFMVRLILSLYYTLSHSKFCLSQNCAAMIPTTTLCPSITFFQHHSRYLCWNYWQPSSRNDSSSPQISRSMNKSAILSSSSPHSSPSCLPSSPKIQITLGCKNS